MPEKQAPWIRYPRCVYRNERLWMSSRMVYGALVMRADSAGLTTAGPVTIGRDVGLQRRQVQECFKQLVDAKLITRTARRRGNTALTQLRPLTDCHTAEEIYRDLRAHPRSGDSPESLDNVARLGAPVHSEGPCTAEQTSASQPPTTGVVARDSAVGYAPQRATGSAVQRAQTCRTERTLASARQLNDPEHSSASPNDGSNGDGNGGNVNDDGEPLNDNGVGRHGPGWDPHPPPRLKDFDRHKEQPNMFLPHVERIMHDFDQLKDERWKDIDTRLARAKVRSAAWKSQDDGDRALALAHEAKTIPQLLAWLSDAKQPTDAKVE